MYTPVAYCYLMYNNRMHVLLLTDQPLSSLGGAQNSVRLQAKYLSRAGHDVTICTSGNPSESRDDLIIVPSVRLTPEHGYYAFWNITKAEKTLSQKMLSRPPVDIVHIQGDYWSAMLGYRYARAHGIRTVITLHNNIVEGLRGSAGMPLAKIVTRLMNRKLHRLFPELSGRYRGDGWEYGKALVALADEVIVPTAHFARALAGYGIKKQMTIIPTGVDDDVLADISRSALHRDSTSIIWSGRMSTEKRPFTLLEAALVLPQPLHVEMYGGGTLVPRIYRFIKARKMTNVVLHARTDYTSMLRAIASSGMLVQTSIGFETQGMTVYEAMALGTPVVLSDKKIAEDLPPDMVQVARGPEREALAAAMTATYSTERRKTAAFARQQFDFRQSVQSQKIIALYAKVLKGGSADRPSSD